MDYFLGAEGIERLYDLLLAQGDALCTIMPLCCRKDGDSDDTLGQKLTRLRCAHGITQRVLAPDTPIGARFREFDTLCRRETRLLPSAAFHPGFEKTITASEVACIDHRHLRACLIRFPALATMEKMLFEVVWKS